MKELIMPAFARTFTLHLVLTLGHVPQGHMNNCSFRPIQHDIVVPSTATRVVWSDSEYTCAKKWHWEISGSSAHNMGLILAFDHIQIVGKDLLKICTWFVRQNRYKKRKSFHGTIDIPMPMFISGTKVLIKIQTVSKLFSTLYSSFNISINQIYFVPKESLRHRGEVGFKTPLNCSFTVPAVIQCDRVWHCLGGEDETDCDYMDPRCGDWIPYKDQCLRFFYPLLGGGKNALKSCSDKYNAQLVEVPTEEDRQFVGSILKRAKQRHMFVGLYKFSGVSGSTYKQLYRFMWQWGKKEYSVAHDLRVIGDDGAQNQCSILFDYGNAFKIKPENCFPPLGCNFMCSKRNKKREHVKQIIKHVALSPTLRHITKFKTKKCLDQSVVQIFYNCPDYIRNKNQQILLTDLKINFSSPSAMSDKLQTPSAMSDKLQSTSAIPDKLQSPSAMSDKLQSPTAMSDKLQSPSAMSDKLQSPSAMSDKLQASTAMSDKLQSPTAMSDKLQSPTAMSDKLQAPTAMSDKLQSPSAMSDKLQAPTAMSDKFQRPPALFQCQYRQWVHHSLVCDGNHDCVDGSDELHCQRPRFKPFLKAFFVCDNNQVIPEMRHCDGMPHCVDGSDEEDCSECKPGNIDRHRHFNFVSCPFIGCLSQFYAGLFRVCIAGFTSHIGDLPSRQKFARTELDGYGLSWLFLLQGPEECPDSHFQCPSGFCIPTYLLNNGIRDCSDGEDEDIPWENFTCPGFYRCHQSKNCVHPDYVCDNIPQCPYKDDELFCQLQCPETCWCEGFVYICWASFDVYQHLNVRYLDLSHVLDPWLSDLHVMEYLHFLNLTACQLTSVELTSLHHLRVLDLSNNMIANITSIIFEDFYQLRHFNVSNNPLVLPVVAGFDRLLQSSDLKMLETLSLVNISLEYISPSCFSSLKHLLELDIRGNWPTGFEVSVFEALQSLRILKTEDPRLCCLLPKHTSPLCVAPEDELSSCADLLKSNFFRVFLWAVSLLAMSGNLGVLVYRAVLDKSNKMLAFRVIVINLCVSDLLMGVYLLMIGVADARYRQVYVASDSQWRHSVSCKMAGFLALMSSEVSAFLICLVTLDRVLVVCFPLRTHLQLTARSSTLLCVVVWGVGAGLASTPLLPALSSWKFYGQTGICLPLPITRKSFPGQQFAFSIFIVLNSVLFLLIGMGQALIFRAIRQAAAATRSGRGDQEWTIARRLFVVTLSDFCCWFPIGVLGLVAADGTPISDQVNVWAAVFIVPLNSALNPFLYTLKAMSDKWQKHRQDRQFLKLVNRLQSEIDRWPEEKVEALVKYCLRHKLAAKVATFADVNIRSERVRR